jgi:toxin ParE1/3/4
VKLRYTIRAAAEPDEILTSIDERSPQGAWHVKERLRAVIDLLLQYPESGRLTSKGSLRRVVAYPYPYLIELIGRRPLRHCEEHLRRSNLVLFRCSGLLRKSSQ